MPEHDFATLGQQYPAIIAGMPDAFTSHEFILCLAQQNQVAYVDALGAYRDALHRGAPAPFMIVHGILARKLLDYPALIEFVGNVDSVDIFGQPNGCAQWRKESIVEH
jgi:hypothetical protein